MKKERKEANFFLGIEFVGCFGGVILKWDGGIYVGFDCLGGFGCGFGVLVLWVGNGELEEFMKCMD